MAKANSSGTKVVLRVALSATVVCVVSILFVQLVVPLLPPLQPLLLYRLRDMLAFVAVTGLIAFGIFSSQRRAGGSGQDRRKPAIEFHPFGSIFGDHDDGLGFSDYTDVVSEGKTSIRSFFERNVADLRTVGWRVSTASSSVRRVSRDDAESTNAVKPLIQRKLHRRSSSLDDTVNYEPQPEVPNSEDDFDAVNSVTSNVEQSYSTPAKKEFTNVQKDDLQALSMSPNELSRQAEAFISKFKEQMRMQKLESFQKYRRRID